MKLVSDMLDSLIEESRKERNRANSAPACSSIEARRNIALAVTELENARYRLNEYLIETQKGHNNESTSS